YTISVGLIVDEEKNRVICAEAGNDFVDALFSFLTLPTGTVIRLLRDQRQQLTLQPADIGCLSNVYRSVETLSSDHLRTDACKDMLLRSRKKPPKYFICPKANCYSSLSYYANARCYFCGEMINRELSADSVLDCGSNADSEDGVFLRASTADVVSDDLKVTTRTPTALVELLCCLGITNINHVSERVMDVGLKESNGKVLYAQAKEDFVDLLFSFLTIPHGSVITCLGADSLLGCLDNLHKSVESLDVKCCTVYDNIKEVVFPLHLVDPKQSNGLFGGFVKRPVDFQVYDD
ncbi:hypothetical protein NMG60_11000271, partial [Bertholletia excelsa]